MTINKENLTDNRFIFGKIAKSDLKFLSFKPNGVIKFQIDLVSLDGDFVRVLVPITNGIETQYRYALSGYQEGYVSLKVITPDGPSLKEWTKIENVIFE